MSDPTIKVGGDSAQAVSALDALKAKLSSVQAGFEDFAKSAEHVGSTVEKAINFEVLRETTDKLKEGINECVAAFGKNEQASLSLGASLKNHGIATEELRDHYRELAEAQAERSKYTVAEITQSETILQNYLGQTEVTKELLQATANFAAAKRIDLLSASDLVAKAVGGETNALARYGIQVDKGASASEKLAQVTEGLQDKFAGQAKAQIQGLGAIGQTSKAFEELEAAIGAKLAPSIERVSAVMKILFDTVRQNDTLVTVIAVTASVAAGILALGTAAVAATLAIPALVAGLSAVATGLAAVGAFFIANPVGLAIAGLVAVTAGLVVAWNKDFGGIQEKIAGVFAAIKAEIEIGISYLKSFATVVAGALTLNEDKVIAGYKSFAAAQLDAIGKVKGAYLSARDAQLEQIARVKAAAEAAAKKGQDDDETTGNHKDKISQNELDDIAKADALKTKIAERQLKDEIARIESIDVKQAATDDDIEAAKERQLELAQRLYNLELKRIEDSGAGELESEQLRRKAALDLADLRQKLTDQADKAEQSLDKTAEDRREQVVQAAYKSGVTAIENLQIKQAKSQEDIEVGLAAQKQIELQAFNDRVAHIDLTTINQAAADSEKDRAAAEYFAKVTKFDEQAAAKRKELADKEAQDDIALTKMIADQGLRGVADGAVRVVGTAIGGPVLSEIFGTIFEKLTAKKAEFRAYFKTLFDSSFIDDLLANMGYAFGKLASPEFWGGFRTGLFNALRDGFKDFMSGIKDGSSADTTAISDQLATVADKIVTTQQEAKDLSQKILVDGLKKTADEATNAMDAAVQSRQAAQKTLDEALTKQEAQQDAVILNGLKARLAEEQNLLQKSQSDQAKAQSTLDALLKQQEAAQQTEAQKKSAAQTADQQFILSRDTQVLTSLQQDKLATQDDLQNSHDAAEIAALQAHLDEVNGKMGAALSRQQAAQSAFDTAKAAADTAAGVKQAAALDVQIAAAKAKLDTANAAVLTATQGVADSQAAITKQEATKEEIITDDKIKTLKEKLGKAMGDEGTARANAAVATAFYTAAEVTDRDNLLAKEQEITDLLKQQQALRDQLARDNSQDPGAGNSGMGSFGNNSKTLESFLPIDKNGKPKIPGGGGISVGNFTAAGSGGGFGLADSGGSDAFGSLKDSIGKVLNFPAPKAANSGGDLASVLARMGVSPGDFGSGIAGAGPGGGQVITIRGDDDFGRMVAKQLARGQALGTSGIRINVGSEG